jgi:transposase InsO family protein
LIFAMRLIHREFRQVYGSPRMHYELLSRNHPCGVNRVARLMRAEGLCARQRQKWRPQTTDSSHGYPVAVNLLDRRFSVSQPNRVWVADMTYIPTREGWLYLAAILDLYSRRVVGWSAGEDLSRSLPLRALQAALDSRCPEPGLIHHSDRGAQYASLEYQNTLARAGLHCSMSRKGNCYDNAVMESFFGTLKTEQVHHRAYVTRQQAVSDLFEYIEVFYNRKRSHSFLNYRTPVEVEREWERA